MARTARPWPLSLRWVLLLGFGEVTWWFLVDQRHDDFRPMQRQMVGWAMFALTVWLFSRYLRDVSRAARLPKPPKTPDSQAFFRLTAMRASLVLVGLIAIAVAMANT